MLRNTFLSLLARVLAIILCNKLHKFIGLNSLTEVGCCTFGIRAIYVELIEDGKVTPLKNYRAAKQTAAPITSQYD